MTFPSIVKGPAVALALSMGAAHIALAQDTTRSAHVPSQILSATRAFISNAGSASFGSEASFRLTRFSGTPDRFYNQFYDAMKRWGHYELAGAPADADLAYEVRFISPIVDQHTRDDFVYDPQLTVTIVDPKTRVTLWALTEHVATSGDRAENDASFDRAVATIAADVQLLSAATPGSAEEARIQARTGIPAATIAAARRQRRAGHSVAGFMVGGIVSGLLATTTVPSCSNPTECTSDRHQASIARAFKIGLSGAAVGAVIGWLWPLD